MLALSTNLAFPDFLCHTPELFDMIKFTKSSNCSNFLLSLQSFDFNTSSQQVIESAVSVMCRVSVRHTFNVGVLGGSVTCGSGLSELYGWPLFLQQYLSLLMPSAAVNVFNAAIGASSSIATTACGTHVFGNLEIDLIVAVETQ